MKPPTRLLQIAQVVGARLDEVLEQESARWMSIDQKLAVPFDEIRRLVSGGKRLRPAFAYWGYVGLGGCDESRVTDLGAAIELLHVMALFHDDIMDGANTRRGEPTAHVRLQHQHQSAGWNGEARRFGEGAAILIGDIAYAMSDQLFGNSSSFARHIWNELRIEVNVGQYLDVLCSASGDRSIETADRICRYKSGKYTVERPLHLGALCANPDADQSLLDALSGFGLPLGDAFQMRDDVMGAFGDPITTGKPVGADLREGKPTPLLARAFARASSPQLEVLRTAGNSDITDAEVMRLQEVVQQTGALQELETLISSLRDDAISALSRIPMSVESREQLTELAHFVSDRDN